MREELSTLTREQDRQNRVEGLEGRQCNVERVFCRSMPRGDTDLELSAIRIVLYTQQPFVAAGVRAVIQAAGISNVLTKSIGTTNPHNVVKATFNALSQLREKQAVADLRGLEIEKL